MEVVCGGWGAEPRTPKNESDSEATGVENRIQLSKSANVSLDF